MELTQAQRRIHILMGALPREEVLHMRRVGILVDLFCRHLHDCGIVLHDLECIQHYGRAAGYHDIGKAWVSPYILSSPEHLSAQEVAAIRRHPVYACQFFNRAAPVLCADIPSALFTAVRDCAIYHHEWWNGKGYPFGLTAEDIPLVSRITSICDAFDAMTSNRVYRPAHSAQYACAELERHAGEQFDPQLVQAFLAAATVLLPHAFQAFSTL